MTPPLAKDSPKVAIQLSDIRITEALTDPKAGAQDLNNWPFLVEPAWIALGEGVIPVNVVETIGRTKGFSIVINDNAAHRITNGSFTKRWKLVGSDRSTRGSVNG